MVMKTRRTRYNDPYESAGYWWEEVVDEQNRILEYMNSDGYSWKATYDGDSREWATKIEQYPAAK